MADAPSLSPNLSRKGECPGHMMCLPALLPWIITFNDTVEWLGVFMDNGFACTKENATESATKLDWERQSARTHDVSSAPPPDLHLLFNEVCRGAWDCWARRESIGRVRLLHLSSPRGAQHDARADPSLRFKAKRTRPRALHDSLLID